MQAFQKTITNERTLQLKTPIGKTLAVTIFLVIVFLILGEAIARQKSFQSLFIAPGIGSSHRQFERQLGRLRRISEEEGKIDCIIIGSSTVWEGFNPVSFRSAIEAKTGKNFSCFNFGVDGLTTAGAGLISQVLIKNYHPQLFIYGSDPRDYTYPLESPENTSIMDSSWIQYQLGQGNILGWLFEHSFLLQYQESIRESLHLQFYRELRRYQDYQEETRWGYIPISSVRVSVSKPPSQNQNTNYVKYYYKLLSNYQIYPENLMGLEQVISQRANGVQVLVVEMPVTIGYMDLFGNGYKDYETYIDKVSDYLEPGQVPFLRTQSNISIPIDSWTDYNHLNEKGTRIFSEWLGLQVVEMNKAGIITGLVP